MAVDQEKVDRFVGRLAEGGASEEEIRAAVRENAALFTGVEEEPGLLSRTTATAGEVLKRGAVLGGIQALALQQGFSFQQQPTLTDIATGQATPAEEHFPFVAEMAVGLPLLNPITALPTVASIVAESAVKEAGFGVGPQILAGILAGVPVDILGGAALSRAMARLAPRAAVRAPAGLLGTQPKRVFLAGEAAPRTLQEGAVGPVPFRPVGAPRVQQAAADAVLERSFTRDLAPEVVSPRDFVEEFAKPAAQAATEAERAAALAGEPTGILARTTVSPKGIRRFETEGGIRGQLMADIESPPVPVQEVPYTPRSFTALKNSPLSEQIAQISRRISIGDDAVTVLREANAAGLKRAAGAASRARSSIQAFTAEFQQRSLIRIPSADLNALGRTVVTSAVEGTTTPPVGGLANPARPSRIRAALGSFISPPVLFDTPMGRPLLNSFTTAHGKAAATLDRFLKVSDRILAPLRTAERSLLRYISETGVDDAKLIELGVRPNRIPILRQAAGQFRAWQDEVARFGGYEPGQGIANYFTRIYKYPKHFEDELETLAKELKTTRAELAIALDVDVPTEVVAKNLLPRTAPEALDVLVDDARHIARAYASQIVRRKFYDPLIRQFDETYLMRMAGSEGDDMARRGQRLIFDFLGMPHRSDIAVGRAINQVAGGLEQLVSSVPERIAIGRRLFHDLANLPPHIAANRVANFATGAEYLSKLGFNIPALLTNLTGFIQTVGEAGFRASARGTIDEVALLFGSKSARETLRHSNVLVERAARETGLWGRGISTLLRVPVLPFEFSEKVLRSFSLFAFRRALAKKGLDPQTLSEEAVRGVLKTQMGFSKPLRPEILRGVAGRVAGQFQTFTLGTASLLGEQVSALLRRGDPRFLKTMAVMVATKSLLENSEIGSRIAPNIGLGWLPAIGYERSTGRFNVRGFGETLGGPTLRDLHRVAQTAMAIWQRSVEEGPVAVGDELSKLILSLVPALKRAALGETLEEQVMGPPVEEVR